MSGKSTLYYFAFKLNIGFCLYICSCRNKTTVTVNLNFSLILPSMDKCHSLAIAALNGYRKTGSTAGRLLVPCCSVLLSFSGQCGEGSGQGIGSKSLTSSLCWQVLSLSSWFSALADKFFILGQFSLIGLIEDSPQGTVSSSKTTCLVESNKSRLLLG